MCECCDADDADASSDPNDLPDIALAAISAGLDLVRWDTEIEPVTVSEDAEPSSSGEH